MPAQRGVHPHAGDGVPEDAPRAGAAHGACADRAGPGGRGDRTAFGGIGRVCRIYARRLYRALGAEDIRHRRTASPVVLLRRLLSLEHVIGHPDLPWLPTETEEVAAFDALGIDRGLLPVRVYRGTAGTTHRYSTSSCPARWTPSAPCSSTPTPATTPRPHSGRGAERTGNTGGRSGRWVGRSRRSWLPARLDRPSGPGR